MGQPLLTVLPVNLQAQAAQGMRKLEAYSVATPTDYDLRLAERNSPADCAL
jgi:hypothetical protein